MSAALNIGSRALITNVSALQVIGHNIANANTAGYSRQSVQTESAGYQMLGGLYYGKGVQLADVTRSHNAYLTREAQLAASVAAQDSERHSRLQQLESLFPIGAEGLGSAVNSMLNAWSDVASSPADLSARVVALAKADDLAARMRETSSQMDALANGGRQQAMGTVTSVNRLAQDIAALNQRIIETQGAFGAPNDLLDHRDNLLREISQHVQVSTVAADDGSISVFVAGSQPLVLGTQSNSLSVSRNPEDPSLLQVSFVQGGVPRVLPEGSVGGSLGGLMTFMNQDLPAMQNLLGRVALAVTSTMNTQHRLGLDLQSQAGGDLFVAPAPAQGIAAGSNTGNAQISAAVSDATALRASDYQVRFEAAGVSIVRLSDGQVSNFASLPAELDGLNFELGAGTGAVGDTFRVRPFVEAARDMELAVGTPRQLAVASPVVVSPGAANSGGLSIESLYASQPSANLNDPVTLTFLANGSFTATGLGPGNPPPDNMGPPPSYNYTPGQPLNFNGWNLTLRGSPAAGDSFQITPSVPGTTVQNGGNAKAVLALRDLATFEGVPLSEGYGTLISHLGTQVQGAQFARSYSDRMASNTENARASVSGVNLDEEAARLLQFQQAYQASAKFMQIAQGMFDTLLQTVGR